MSPTDAARSIEEKFASAVLEVTEFRGESTVRVERSALVDILTFCRDKLAFDYLVDLTTVDNSGRDPRFEAVYELYAYRHQLALRVKAAAPEDDAEFPSVVHLWSAANWHEREAWDMMGIRFAGHPNLTRILMWEGYPFFPLRKEFPLAGKPSEMPDVAFSSESPMQGGPFVTSSGADDTIEREPRAHPAP